jgi:hypothetical protein
MEESHQNQEGLLKRFKIKGVKKNLLGLIGKSHLKSRKFIEAI